MQQLEQILNCERQPFSVEALWGESRPEDQPESLGVATGTISLRDLPIPSTVECRQPTRTMANVRGGLRPPRLMFRGVGGR
jgi:hypothetical protein